MLDIFSKKKEIIKKDSPKEKIQIDYREKNSLVVSHLMRLGFEVELKELKVGDYITKDTVIERKTVTDFVSSMTNKRLIKQLEELQQFENRLLLIEGLADQDIYSNNINDNAIRGFLLSISLKHKVPIIFTNDPMDTAMFISVLAKKQTKEMSLHGKKKTLDSKEQLEFVVQSFPGIGPKKSRELLERFGSVQNIINAPIEDLQKVLGKKAQIIIDIVNRKY